MMKSKVGLRGCIKSTRGPWVVHRATKDGRVVSRLRFPSERERQNNKERERRRRAVAGRIFSGLRAHGNYQLPAHSDTNDLLIALCQEAGWIVQPDGTISRKRNQELEKGVSGDYCCTCHDYQHSQIDLSLTL